MGAFSHSVEPLALFTNRTSQASRPQSSGDGYPITDMEPHQLTAIFLKANGGDCTLTGPVEVFGYHVALAEWFSLGSLNDTSDIALYDGGPGYSEPLQHMRNFSRIDVRAGGISANGFDAYLAGIDVSE